MAFSNLGSIGATGSSGNNQASLALTTTATCAVGELVVVVVAVDNPSNGGDSGVSGVQNSGTANTWTKAIQIQNALAAQGGASCSIWYTVVTTQITSGATITATFNNATTSDASGLTARHFSMGTGSTVAIEGTPGTLVNNTGADPGSLNVTTANIECVRVRGIASQVGNNTNLTPTSTWTAWANGNSATTGTTAEMCARAESLISTATGAASDPTYVSAIYASAYVAFREVLPPAADAWNSADKAANVTLSASDKTATTTSATTAGARSTQVWTNGTAGKYYAEIVLGSTPNGLYGLSPTSNALTADALTCYVAASGPIRVNLVGTGKNLGSLANGDIICIAWDAGAELVWFRKTAGNWNNTVGDDPATGVGGADFSIAASTPHALWRLTNTSGAIETIRTEFLEFTQAVPSGFQSWMGETLDAWNANDKGLLVSLSSDHKQATSSSADSGVRSTQQRVNQTAGKYYAEFQVNTANSNSRYGVLPAATVISGTGSAAGGVSVNVSTSVIQFSGTGSTGVALGSVPVANDVICIAVDTGAEKIWFRKNSASWFGDPSADPVAGTNGLDYSAVVGAENIALWFQSFFAGSGESGTIRTELVDYTQPVPTGYLSWMGETPAPPASLLFTPLPMMQLLVR